MAKLSNYKADDGGGFLQPGKYVLVVTKVEPKDHASCTAFMVYFKAKNKANPKGIEMKKGFWTSPDHASEFVQRKCGDLLVALQFVNERCPDWPADHTELIGKTCVAVLKPEEYVSKDWEILESIGIDGFYTMDEKSPKEHIEGLPPKAIERAVANCETVRPLGKKDRMRLDAGKAVVGGGVPGYGEANDEASDSDLPF